MLSLRPLAGASGTALLIAHPWALLLMLPWLLFIGQTFWSLGMTTQDQIIFSTWGAGSLAANLHHAWELAQVQGRVYFLLNKPLEFWLAAHPELLLTKSLTIAGFLLAPWSFAYLVFRAWREQLLFIWIYFGLAWVGYSHLPPAAYPVMNSAPFLLWALIAFCIRHAERAPRVLPLLVAGLSLLAFCQYEPITAMSALAIGWVLITTPLEPYLKRRFGIAIVSSALFYALVYLVWRVFFGTQYEGLIAGDLSPATVFGTFIAYTLGALPDFFSTVPWLWGDAQVGEIWLGLPAPLQAATIGPVSLALVLSVLLAGLGVFVATCTEPPVNAAAATSRRSGGAITGQIPLILFMLLLLVAANGLISIGGKYQQWAAGAISTPYLTGRLALLPLVGMLLALVQLVRDLLPAGLRRPYWLLAIVVIGATGLWVQSLNQVVAPRQRANLSKWEAVAALVRCTKPILSEVIVAPGLFFSLHSREADWTIYWQNYVRVRFDREINIHAEMSPTDSSHALLEMHHGERGELRALTLARPGELIVMSRNLRIPASVFAGGVQSWPLLPEHSEDCGGGYHRWSFPNPTGVIPARLQLLTLWPR